MNHPSMLLTCTAITLCQLSAMSDVQSAQLGSVTLEASNPGQLDMFVYLPQSADENTRLVVTLHGCTQSADDFAKQSGFLELAEEQEFALLAPQQRNSNNTSLCFHWFLSADASRDQGEALSIFQMIRQLIDDDSVDPNSIYIAGLSSGGAMTSAMLASYPELFRGGAIFAGIPYGCATSLLQSASCSNGVDRSPAQWAQEVLEATDHRGPWPTVSIWHGDADMVVSASNADELLEQWTAVHDVLEQTPQVDNLGGRTRTRFADNGNRVLVERHVFAGMGHAVPNDPGTEASQCGQSGSYAADVNVCAAREFLGLWTADGGSEAPDAGGGADGGMAPVPPSDGGCQLSGTGSPSTVFVLFFIAVIALCPRRSKRKRLSRC